MRGVVLVLLVANLAFLGWNFYQVWVPPEGAPPAAERAGKVNRMLLRHELETAQAAPPSVSSPGAAEPLDAATFPGPPDAGGTDSASDSSVVPGDGPASGQEREGAPAGGGVDAERYCYRVGPLAPDTPRAPWREKLAAVGGDLSEEWEEVERPSRYWVYLPPRASVDEAREELARLRGEEVTDFIRVMQGPMINAISLGLYSQERSAEQRMADLRERGFEPRLEVRYQNERRLWLVLQLPSAEVPWELPAGATAMPCP